MASQLRHVRPHQHQQEDASEDRDALASLKKFDLFPKAQDDAEVRSQSGAITTVCVFLITLWLIGSEFANYRRPVTQTDVGVDLSTGGKMDIALDMTFLEADCGTLEMHEVDNASQQEINVPGMTRVDVDTLSGLELNPGKGDPSFCDPCPAPKVRGLLNWFSKTAQCCNTCLEAKSFANEKGLDMDLALKSTACLRETFRNDVRRTRGCRVFGTVTVPKLAGNFHFGLINTTHRIDQLEFLMPKSETQSSFMTLLHSFSSKAGPLDKEEKIVAEQKDVFFRYYLKVVPSAKILAGQTIDYYQYSVTQSKKVQDRNKGVFVGRQRKNGIFFVYEISPFKVTTSTNSMSFLHFLVNLCAVVGGVFTVAGMANTGISRVYSRFFTKHAGGLFGMGNPLPQ